MLRAALVIISLPLFGWGGLYWLDIRYAGNNDPPVPTTVAEIFNGYPCSSESQSYSPETYLRLENVEADAGRSVSGSFGNYAYVPVKGTDDKLYLEVGGSKVPPPGPTTVIGHQMHSAESLPDQLVPQAKQGKLFLVRYENRSYWSWQHEKAGIFFILGGIALGLAGAIHAGQFLGRKTEQRKLEQASAAADVPSGPCSICGTVAPRFKVHIFAEKRRLIAPRLARITSLTLSGECCPACYVRLGSLWKVSLAWKILMAPLLFGAMFGAAMLVMRSSGTLVLVFTVAFFFFLQWWTNRQYDQILGPFHTELKQKLNVSMWNPIADKITYHREAVANPPQTPTGSEIVPHRDE